jgi:hypothetical protein
MARLGGVDGFDQDKGTGERDEGSKVLCRLLAAQGDALEDGSSRPMDNGRARIGCEFLRILKRILLTLAMRPIHAFLFGRAADRWGRRPTLMVDVLLYSFIEFASCFSPNLTVLLVLRRSETTTVSH